MGKPRNVKNNWSRASSDEEWRIAARRRLARWLITGRGPIKDRLLSFDQISNNLPRWLIDQVIPTQSVVFISAPAKSGKSFLALHLALSIARGDKFLGEFKTSQSPILYYCLEDSLREVKVRAKNFCGQEPLPNNVFFLSPHISLDLQSEEDLIGIQNDVKRTKAKLIIIDTFRRASLVDENESKDVALVMRGIRTLVKANRISVVLIHHTGHGRKNYYDPSAWLRGSTDLTASFDALIALTRVEKRKNTVHVKVFHRLCDEVGFSYSVEKSTELDERTHGRPIKSLKFLKYANWSKRQINKSKKAQVSGIVSQSKRTAKEIAKLITICQALESGTDKKMEISQLEKQTKMPRQTLASKLTKLTKNKPQIVKEAGKRGNALIYQLVQTDYKELLN